MGRLLALLVWLLAVPAPALALPPIRPPVPLVPVEAPPTVTAASYLLYDATYGLSLASKDPDARRPMASTTKIMTALVVLLRTDLDDRVVISENAAEVGEAEIGLWPGETWTVRQLLTAVEIRSANDAASALAEYVGGSVEGFVEIMNEESARLGLTNTAFRNPHGLDQEGHYSSARDLLTITLAAMEERFFAEVARLRRARFPADPEGTARVAETTNRLLSSFEGAIGVKTGFTHQAGLVLVAGAERDGRRLYAVVMGSEGGGAHFADAAALLEYGFTELALVPAIVEGRRPSVAVATGPPLTFLLHLAAAGLLTGDPPAVDPTPEPEPAAPVPPSLPDLAEALSWSDHYWRWLAGDG